jgi:hypothetical protein
LPHGYRCFIDGIAKTYEGLNMNNAVPILIAAVTLLGGTTISNAQDRDRPQAAASQKEGMHRGEGSHKGDVERDHRHRLGVIVVGVPIFYGPVYGYYETPPMDAYRTIEGFYYYCNQPAGYYPAIQDCPSGWRLVP